MKKVCPKDSSHQFFYTTAVICQEWLVDDVGDFIEVAEECTEIFHRPQSGNVWECAVCGAEAEDVELKLVEENAEEK
jgi:hypothetical protein